MFPVWLFGVNITVYGIMVEATSVKDSLDWPLSKEILRVSFTIAWPPLYMVKASASELTIEEPRLKARIAPKMTTFDIMQLISRESKGDPFKGSFFRNSSF